MATDVKLGELATAKAKRDAVHVAIAPVIAGQELRPGQRVRIVEGSAYNEMGGKCVGVVDPFLEANVNVGEWFYVLLTPGTVTDLRHEWTHEAFEDKDQFYVDPWANDECRGC